VSAPAPMSVVLGGSTANEVRAIPVVVRSDRQHLALALRGEILFDGWRQALAFCDVLGIPVMNREAAEQLAAMEDLPKLTGACPTCGRATTEEA
jgi:hypothetical protein